jgi:hypothetical protein
MWVGSCIPAYIMSGALSLLKRWILGTYQGSIVPAHLQACLEEFTFRFNRRIDSAPFTVEGRWPRVSRS